MDDIFELVKSRHSVRSYTDKPIDGNVKEELENIIEKCNNAGKLNIKLFLNEPKAFDTFMAHYGKFNNVKNYIVLKGDKSKNLEERCGYFGQEIVMKAQELGLNTCWVAMTYGKRKVPYKLSAKEKIVCTLAIGYGTENGVSHNIKAFEDVSITKENFPDWYKKGIEFALLAPTAMNQQKFSFKLTKENKVKAEAKKGFYTKVDLGIAKYNFELGAEKENFEWAN